MSSFLCSGTALTGIVEWPAVIFIYYAIESHGRKPSAVSFLFLAGVFCVGIRILSPSWTTVLALCGKLCVSSSWQVRTKT